MEAAAGVPVLFDGKLFAPGLTGPGVVRETLSTLGRSGLAVLRINAFAAISWSVGAGAAPRQRGPPSLAAASCCHPRMSACG